jgi:YgiT-type zinc finger domain-containing protein
MDKTCNFCGNKGFRTSVIQYVYHRDNKYLLVNNVPCEQCDYCGEQYFEAKVLKKIEAEFKGIHQAGKPARREITVPVEEFAEIG